MLWFYILSKYDRFISSAHLLIVFGKSVFAAHEGGGVGQVEEPEGEEPTEYPPRGLRNDSGGMLVFLHLVFCSFRILYSSKVGQFAGKNILCVTFLVLPEVCLFRF